MDLIKIVKEMKEHINQLNEEKEQIYHDIIMYRYTKDCDSLDKAEIRINAINIELEKLNDMFRILEE